MVATWENVAFLFIVYARITEQLKSIALTMELCGVLSRVVVSPVVRQTVGVRWEQLTLVQQQVQPQHLRSLTLQPALATTKIRQHHKGIVIKSVSENRRETMGNAAKILFAFASSETLKCIVRDRISFVLNRKNVYQTVWKIVKNVMEESLLQKMRQLHTKIPTVKCCVRGWKTTPTLESVAPPPSVGAQRLETS